MLDIKKLLISMPELTSVSGFESERIEDFKELIGPYFDEINTPRRKQNGRHRRCL